MLGEGRRDRCERGERMIHEDEHVCRGEKWGKGHRMKLEAQTGIRTYKTLYTILKILNFMPRSMDSHNISIDLINTC